MQFVDIFRDMSTEVYGIILKIAAPIAVVSIAVAILVSMFSHNPKATEVAKTVIKDVIIGFIALFLLVTIFNWIYGMVTRNGGGSTDFAM